jgi:hypothetical protein
MSTPSVSSHHFFNATMQGTSQKVSALAHVFVLCIKKIQACVFSIFEKIKHFFVSLYQLCLHPFSHSVKEIPAKIPKDIQHKTLLLTTTAQHGYGDLVAIMKIAQAVEEHLPNNTIYYLIPNGYKKSFMEVYPKVQHALFEEDLQGSVTIGDKIREIKPDCIVSFRMSSLWKGFPKIPSIRFSEYADFIDNSTPAQPGQAAHREFGLGPKSVQDKAQYLGLFGSDALIQYSKDPKNEQAIHRLSQYLPKLSPELCRAILGTELTQETMQSSLEDFTKKAKVYFGYASGGAYLSWFNAFVGAVLLLNKEKHVTQEELVFVLPGGIPNVIKEEMQAFLQTQGVQELILMTSKDKGQSFKEEKVVITPAVKETEGIKRIKVIAPKALEPKAFLDAMLASEPQVLTTGDQSLTEALMAGKHVVYQCLSHKNGLAWRLHELLYKYMGDTSIFKRMALTQDKKKKSDGLAGDCHNLKQDFMGIKPDQWKLFIEDIQQLDCRPKIAKAIEEALVEGLAT